MAKRIIQFLVFGVNLAAVGVGALFFKHQADEKVLVTADSADESIVEAVPDATAIPETPQDIADSATQKVIATDRQAKLDQLATNPATVTETKTVQKLVPGTGVTVTKKTTGSASATSTASAKSSTSTVSKPTATTTTKKS